MVIATRRSGPHPTTVLLRLSVLVGALGVLAFLAFGAILFVTVGRVPRPGRG